MSGKCIIIIPQDNQSKPSNILEQRTLPNILGYMSWEDTTSWADLNTERQPRTLVTSPFIIRPHLICKSPGYNGKLLNPPSMSIGGRPFAWL